MKVSRRRFLQMGIKLLGGAVVVYAASPKLLSAVLQQEATGKPAELPEADHYWGFVVDARKCIGCFKCLEACKTENRVPPSAESRRTWLERYEIGEDGSIAVDSVSWGRKGPESMHQELNGGVEGQAKRFFVPKLCNQCDNPPCVPVCPVSATFKTSDGVVLIDETRCIGCKYCIAACPYGARYLNPETRVADKCTWCYHRISRGLQPACVEVCPVGARLFGDLRDPESPVRRFLRKEMTQVLKPYLGTKPKVFYAGLQEGVR